MFRTLIYAMLLGLALVATACASATTQPVTATLAPTTALPQQAALVAADTSDVIRLVLVPEQSEARYRVREQLAGVSLPSDAIGATKVLTGTIVGKRDGTIVSTESKFRVDLRTLKSNDDRRDNFLRRSTLETDKYPYADFVATEAPGLPLSLPASGDLEFKLIGNLTVHDVTKPVTWDVKGKVQSDEAVGTATTSFTFAYFNLQQPRVPLVLSVEDTIRLELDLHLRRQSK